CSSGGGGGGGSARDSPTKSAESTTSQTAPAGASTTTADVASRYQTVVARAEQATCTFNKGVAALGPNPKVRETKNLVPPVTAALRRFRRELGQIPWPDAAKKDAADLQRATDALISDIETLPDQSPGSMSAWTAKTRNDKATFASVTRSLRGH